MSLSHLLSMCLSSDPPPLSPETLGSVSGAPTLAKVVHDSCNLDSRRSRPQEYELKGACETTLPTGHGSQTHCRVAAK